jgi:hypothetical protein
MSSSLDRLKALTGRLEEKLEQKSKSIKKELDPSVEKTSETIVTEKSSIKKPVEENHTAESVVERPVTEKTAKTKTLSKTNADEIREQNIVRVKNLYEKLKIFEKSPDFDTIFMYKAMNLSGIGLKEEDFGEVREGKYIQIIAITYEPDKNGKKKAKNISLGYFGKADTLDGTLKNEIIEFVLRWRYEKAFQNVAHYKDLIGRLDVPVTTLF